MGARSSASSASKYKSDKEDIPSGAETLPSLRQDPTSPTVHSRIQAVRRARFESVDDQLVEDRSKLSKSPEASAGNRALRQRIFDEEKRKMRSPSPSRDKEKDSHVKTGHSSLEGPIETWDKIHNPVSGIDASSSSGHADDLDFELRQLISSHDRRSEASRQLHTTSQSYDRSGDFIIRPPSSGPQNGFDLERHRLIVGHDNDAEDYAQTSFSSHRLAENSQKRSTALQGGGRSVLEDSLRPSSRANMLSAVDTCDFRPGSVLSSSKSNVLAPQLEAPLGTRPRSALKSSENRKRPHELLTPTFADGHDMHSSPATSSSLNPRTEEIIGKPTRAAARAMLGDSRGTKASPRPHLTAQQASSQSPLTPIASRSPRRAAIQEHRLRTMHAVRLEDSDSVCTSALDVLSGFRTGDKVATHSGAEALEPWADMGDGHVLGPDPKRKGYLLIEFERGGGKRGESFSIKASNLSNLTRPWHSPRPRDPSPSETCNPFDNTRGATIPNPVLAQKHDPMGGFKIGDCVGIGEDNGYGMGTVVQEGSTPGQVLVSCGDLGIRSIPVTQLIKHSRPRNVMGEVDNEVIKARMHENQQKIALSLFECSLGGPSRQQLERIEREKRKAAEAAFYGRQDLSSDPNKGFRPGDFVTILNPDWFEKGRGIVKGFGDKPGTIKVQFGRQGDWWMFDVCDLQKERAGEDEAEQPPH